MTLPHYTVHIRRLEWCDFACEIYRDRWLVGEARCTSHVAAWKCAHDDVRRRRKNISDYCPE